MVPGGWRLAVEGAILAGWLIALVRTIVNLLLVPRLRVRAVPSGAPLVSVIIPARDEERSIERTVRAFLAQTWTSLEVIVINDRSVDATGAILASISDPRLLVIDNEEPPAGWLGKPWALHQGSLRAHGELLLFVDADVLYEPDAVTAAVTHLEERNVPMLSLFPHFVLRGFWEHVAMPNLAFFAFSSIPLWLSNRSSIPLLGIGAGTGNLIRRADYDAVGGHVALQDAVVDDVGLARLVRRSGRRTEVARAEDFLSVRMYEGLGEIVRGFTKNAFATVGRSYVTMAILAIVAVAMHLAPYALAITGDMLALATIAAITLTRIVLYLPMRYGLVNALLAHPLMIGVWGVIMMRSTWYTGIRRQVQWRGRTYDARNTRFGAD